ncbi:DUF1513 domain-containing protein [Pseudoteredinibacter isoporae]|uniref:DUF1513 domain-containing protein n=1 Tax=Pseudoteredinibacter isoporae TaxID=570281 RepID=A0A7X0JWK9_9GAMM|nr:DUF1513 domain-containing protein [Pseudoteredinibacter isoporae]MBB6523587.1 hypothetical protein [Pseudoteredinibacter isoporae]NHO89095.1 DUF1513 domain-containing protein [Pseudoteredinibacter isoporae]NIB22294.1 DUF1513 domain-containing protein [Pseudoteredinibacter isoporae]
MTAINRREFLLGSVGLSVAAIVGCASKPGNDSLLLSGFQHQGDKGRRYGVAGMDLQGKLRFSLSLPQRLHQVMVLPSVPSSDAMKGRRECLAIARRPGTELYHIDVDSGELLNNIQSPDNRHVFGHACIIGEGDHVLVPQNHLDEKASSLAVYDRKAGWTLIDEIALPNVGPHQVECLSDGKTLAVAMGGIHTRPESGRQKLNIDTMQSSLLYLDSHSGKVLGEYRPEDPKLSLRHMAVTADDQVIIGAQFQGDANYVLPLAYKHRGENELQALTAGNDVWQMHRQYVGSVSVDDMARQAYLSSPRAGIVSRWDLQSGTFIEHLTIRDACGLAYAKEQQGFYISNGAGQMVNSAIDTSQIKAFAYQQGIIWDNHLSFIR